MEREQVDLNREKNKIMIEDYVSIVEIITYFRKVYVFVFIALYLDGHKRLRLESVWYFQLVY